MRDPDDVYFRPLMDEKGTVHICHMQWFDEYDYDQSKFLTEDKFSTEKDALDWCIQYDNLTRIERLRMLRHDRTKHRNVLPSVL